MAEVAERHESYAASFDAFRRAPGFGQGALAEAREAAFSRFVARGLPTTRDEEWRFTNIAPLRSTTFVPAGPAAVAAAALAPWTLGDAVAARVVLVNGRYVPQLSAATLPKGVTLRAGGASDAPVARTGVTALAELNAALFPEAIVIEVAPKAIVSQPIRSARHRRGRP